ncbi:hypothetical protein BOW53_08475 [Solemya pervernicosa gill symbiont]|uniref:HigA2-like helix-turn-helix domain-containing protein n=1 Tax=Solemya pervernicosa gill symbiont TaxID=642797 RepID=A0A1T2L5D1_9GAMM|nr:XRE family transcriptional regulator [Solemya pervernicosa gill symbiont]OOZ40271.1 hypothetical protein BOW53_08475 [Solemya pervernicosa gill symbiont]
MATHDTTIQHTTPANGNVFDDLGFPPLEANKLQLKAQLMVTITQWVNEHQLTQQQAAEQLEVSRPRVSDVVNGKIEKFTIDALVDMIEHTGQHVTMNVA